MNLEGDEGLDLDNSHAEQQLESRPPREDVKMEDRTSLLHFGYEEEQPTSLQGRKRKRRRDMEAAAVHQERYTQKVTAYTQKVTAYTQKVTAYTQRMADGEAAMLAKGMGIMARYKLEDLEEMEE
jgi:hypothetical protein